LIIFFGSLYQTVIIPFIDGIEYGLFRVQYESDSNIDTDNFLLMDIVPKQSDYMEKTEINLKSSEEVLIRPSNISIIVKSLPDKPFWWTVLQVITGILTFSVVIIGLWILFLVVKILKSLQKSDVFDRQNIKRINKIGFFMLFTGVAISVLQFINIFSAQYLVDLSNYEFSYAKSIDFNAIIMGLIILIMNEVMKSAIEIKEEQDLTI
jgi:hypothetical protein